MTETARRGAKQPTRATDVVSAWQWSPSRAIVFDFNGTLCDDEAVLFEIFKGIAEQDLHWTLSPRHYYSRLAGRSDREILEVMLEGRAADEPVLLERLLDVRGRRYREIVTRNSPVRSETIELLHMLDARRVPLGIVTGAQRADVDHVVESCGLGPVFGAIVTAEDVSNGKPDPEGFLACAERLGVGAEDVLVFEDSRYGIRAAKGAGMRCIAVEYRGGNPVSTEADAVVPQLDRSLFAGMD